MLREVLETFILIQEPASILTKVMDLLLIKSKDKHGLNNE